MHITSRDHGIIEENFETREDAVARVEALLALDPTLEGTIWVEADSMTPTTTE